MASCELAREGIYLTMVNDSTDHEKGKLKNNFNKRQERRGWSREEGVKKEINLPSLNVSIPKIFRYCLNH